MLFCFKAAQWYSAQDCIFYWFMTVIIYWKMSLSNRLLVWEDTRLHFKRFKCLKHYKYSTGQFYWLIEHLSLVQESLLLYNLFIYLVSSCLPWGNLSRGTLILKRCPALNHLFIFRLWGFAVVCRLFMCALFVHDVL